MATRELGKGSPIESDFRLINEACQRASLGGIRELASRLTIADVQRLSEMFDRAPTHDTNERERTTILAALMLWRYLMPQSLRAQYHKDIPFASLDLIASQGHKFEALNSDEVRSLIEEYK